MSQIPSSATPCVVEAEVELGKDDCLIWKQLEICVMLHNTFILNLILILASKGTESFVI